MFDTNDGLFKEFLNLGYAICMASKLSTVQWSEILSRQELTKKTDLSIFQALYSFEGHKAYASQIGMLLGYKGKAPQAPLNLEIGRLGKRIAKYYDIQLTERSAKKYKYWDLFFNGWKEGSYFVWQLRPELAQALHNLKLTGEQPYAEELSLKSDLALPEGAKKTLIVNSYERNPKARSICIDHWGCKCSACNFDFASVYGAIGTDFIHVHHLVPLAEIGRSYQVSPIHDLRPVCPNCHAMLHTSNPPLSIEQLREIIHVNRELVD
ncbi:MAG: HNH endonuclease [Deinococcales bacterium]